MQLTKKYSLHLFLDDFGFKDLVSFWDDTAGARNKTYVVQTAERY